MFFLGRENPHSYQPGFIALPYNPGKKITVVFIHWYIIDILKDGFPVPPMNTSSHKQSKQKKFMHFLKIHLCIEWYASQF